MNIAGFKTTLLTGALCAIVSVSANAAVYVNPVSSDGPGKDLQTQLNLLGYSTDVNADQVDASLFTACPGMTPHLDILFQIAGHAPDHKLGDYVPGNAPAYVVGGTNSGLPMSSDFADPGVPFGLALNDPDAGHIYFTQQGLNSDNYPHAVVLKNKINGVVQDCSYIVAWEDLPFGSSDLDYNDIVVRVNNVQATPEPGTVAYLLTGLPVIGLAVRRRLRK